MSGLRIQKVQTLCVLCWLFAGLANTWAETEATGLVEPEWEATLAATVLGRVESVAVTEGTEVEAGAVLVYLERNFEELDAQRRKIVAESEVELELAKRKLEVLKAEFEGTKQLYEGRGSVSKEEYERSRLEFLLSESELAQLQQRKRIEMLEWELAQEQVSRRELRTPQAGVVVDVFPEVGEVCEPRQPMVRIVNANTVRVNLDMDALDTGEIATGETARVLVNSPGGEIATEGVVDFVSPVVDGASGLRRIRVSIENGDGAILPGLSARLIFSDS